jgi:hypothetical protein
LRAELVEKRVPVVAGHGCIVVGTTTERAAMQSWQSAAWVVEMTVRHCYLHNKSLHSRHPTRLREVLVADRRKRTAEGIADLLLGVEVGGTLVFDRLGQVVILLLHWHTRPSSGTAATAVVAAGTGRKARHMTVEA